MKANFFQVSGAAILLAISALIADSQASSGSWSGAQDRPFTLSIGEP